MNQIASSSPAAVDMSAFGRVVDPIIANIVDPIVWLLFAIALVVFAYGVFQMIWSDSEDSRKKGKLSIIGGLIGMFIMFSAWGIIHLVSDTVMRVGG